MKTIKNATLIALTLLTATQAVASNCDLTVVPEIMERQNPVVIKTFKGKRDWVGAGARKILLLTLGAAVAPAFPVSIAGFALGSMSPNDPQKSEAWYQAQYNRLQQRCNDYIREHFPQDILADNGGTIIAAHYYCGEPYQYQVTSRRIRPAIDLMAGDAVYAAMPAEQMIAQKCEKLQRCIALANAAADLEQLQQTQIQLGCQ